MFWKRQILVSLVSLIGTGAVFTLAAGSASGAAPTRGLPRGAGTSLEGGGFMRLGKGDANSDWAGGRTGLGAAGKEHATLKSLPKAGTLSEPRGESAKFPHDKGNLNATPAANGGVLSAVPGRISITGPPNGSPAAGLNVLTAQSLTKASQGGAALTPTTAVVPAAINHAPRQGLGRPHRAGSTVQESDFVQAGNAGARGNLPSDGTGAGSKASNFTTSKCFPKVGASSEPRGASVASLGHGDILKVAPVANFGFLSVTAEKASNTRLAKEAPAVGTSAFATPSKVKTSRGSDGFAISAKAGVGTSTLSALGERNPSAKIQASSPTVSTSAAQPTAAKISASSPDNAPVLQPLAASATQGDLATAPSAPAAPTGTGTLTVATFGTLAAASPTTFSMASVQIAPALNPSIILDSSLGQTGQPTMTTDGNYGIDAGLGKWVSGNLFFSFSQFGLETGESATFTNHVGLTGVQNILARVTGGSLSNIDGLIASEISGVNLFLINPAGFVFGPNASLNVPGSITVTTADYVNLADGNRFAAVSGAGDRSLSAASVSAFGFLPGQATPPAPVTFSGSSFSTLEGMNFAVLAGDQTVDGAFLSAPAGRLTLVSVAGPGEISASLGLLATTPLEVLPDLGTVTLTHSAFITAGSFGTGEAGHIEIDAKTVSLSSSFVTVSTDAVPIGFGGTDVSSIFLRSQNLLISQSTISANASGYGKGGTIEIRANSMMTLSKSSQIESAAFDQATGGNVSVTTDAFSVSGSRILTSTFGAGAAGNIDVMANDLLIKGVPGFVASGILAESGTMSGNATGRGGDVSIVAGRLTLLDGGQISANTFDAGPGGNVFVSGSDITISGFSTFNNRGTPIVFQSGVFANSELAGTQGLGGNSGSVAVTANHLQISDGGQIATSTVGSGDGGSVTVAGGVISLHGGTTEPTGIAATTSFQRGGKGGNIMITAGALEVLDGAKISAATEGTGDGGSISINGGSVLISGGGSAIAAQTLAPDGGAGGNLRFNVNSVKVIGSGLISASTLGSGRGGSIEITADQVMVDGNSSSIRVDTSGTNKMVDTDPFVRDLTLTLGADYDPVSDLNALLINPSGNSIVLFNVGDASGTNFTNTAFSDAGAASVRGGVGPYSGTFQPSVPLGLLKGGTANGIWQLEILNLGLGSGTLQTWSLAVNGHQFAARDVPQSLEPFSIVTSTVTVVLPIIQTQVQAGKGGNIQINAGAIDLRNGGTVTASTHGDGVAGLLNIQASSINIDAKGATSDTGLFASTEPSSTGRGGSISILANDFQVRGNSHLGIAGGVIARSTTDAPAGNIVLQGGNVTLDANAIISSANLGGGPAGSVNLTAANAIVLQGGSQVTALSRASDAGTISLTAGRSIELHGNSTITASAGANGGNVDIVAGNLFFLDYSSIVATAGTSLQGGAAGRGGNITVDPTFIILDHATISANAAIGLGGNILLRGDYFLSSESLLTATGSTAGTVKIVSLELDLVGGLIGLPGNVLDVSRQLREQCALRLGEDFNSFLILGRGGVEASPDEALDEPASERMGEKEDARGIRKSRKKGGVQLALPPASLPR